jgi:transcription initiation factor TFIID TATA-box-binding protein
MDQIQTHPSNAAQAKTFIAPGSLSFPGGAGELTPPSEADKQNGIRNGQMNGSQQQGAQSQNGNGVTPATPAATPGATTTGVSGIVPTLQYVFPLSLIFNT